MAKESDQSRSNRANRDVINLIADQITVGGSLHLGGGNDERASRPAPTNVPTPSPTFVPRKPLTAEIHARLRDDAGHAAVLRQAVARAHGGYGKTVAAILYAHEYAPHYPGGRFFLSMERTDFAQAIGNLAPLLGLTPSKNPADDAPAVKRLLENNPRGPVLLILDNVTDPAQWDTILATGLVPRGRCAVLITTRAERIPQAAVVRVDRLTHEEGREVYRRFCQLADVRGGGGRPVPSDATADAVTDLVGGLAVAVAAVAARMKLRPAISWDDYLATLRTLPVERLPDASPEVRAEIGTDGQALAEHRRTLHVIDDALAALPPAERRAVEYAALLPEDKVPAPWLTALLEADAARDDGPMKIALAPEPDLPDSPSLRVLQHLDALDVLLESGEEGKLLTLHRLWRARVNERAADSRMNRISLLHAIAFCAAQRGSQLASPDDRHIHRWIAAENRWELSPLASLIAKPQILDFDHPDVAAIHVCSAFVFESLGQSGIAEPLFRDALAMYQRMFPGDHPSVATALNNLASAVESIGRAGDAKPLYRDALAMSRRLLPRDNNAVATNLNNLASVLSTLGRNAEAEPLFRDALAMRMRLFPGDHPDVASSLSNLGSALNSLGHPRQAESLYRDALDMRKRLFPGDHPDVATSLNNLGATLKALGHVGQAESFYRNALAMRTRLFPGDHPNTATSLNNLASVLEPLARIGEAERLYRDALAMRRRLFPNDHPDVATSLSNLAALLYGQGKTEESRRLIHDAAEMILRVFDAAHPTSRNILTGQKIVSVD